MTMTTDITKALQTMQDTVLPPLTHHATIDRPSLVILYSTALLFAFSLSATHSVKYYFVIYLGGKLSDVVYTFMIFSFVGCLAPFVASVTMTKTNPRYTYRPLFVMCSLIAIVSVSNGKGNRHTPGICVCVVCVRAGFGTIPIEKNANFCYLCNMVLQYDTILQYFGILQNLLVLHVVIILQFVLCCVVLCCVCACVRCVFTTVLIRNDRKEEEEIHRGGGFIVRVSQAFTVGSCSIAHPGFSLVALGPII